MTYPAYSVSVDQRSPDTLGGEWAVTLYAQARKYARREPLCEGTGSRLSVALAALASGAKRAVPQ